MICDWRKKPVGQGKPEAVFCWGDEPDKKRPAKKSQSQMSSESRKRKKLGLLLSSHQHQGFPE